MGFSSDVFIKTLETASDIRKGSQVSLLNFPPCWWRDFGINEIWPNYFYNNNISWNFIKNLFDVSEYNIPHREAYKVVQAYLLCKNGRMSIKIYIPVHIICSNVKHKNWWVMLLNT